MCREATGDDSEGFDLPSWWCLKAVPPRGREAALQSQQLTKPSASLASPQPPCASPYKATGFPPVSLAQAALWSCQMLADLTAAF